MNMADRDFDSLKNPNKHNSADVHKVMGATFMLLGVAGVNLSVSLHILI